MKRSFHTLESCRRSHLRAFLPKPLLCEYLPKVTQGIVDLTSQANDLKATAKAGLDVRTLAACAGV